MKKILLLLCLISIKPLSAQITVKSGLSSTEITNYLVGQGLTISNLQTNSNPRSIGFFSGKSNMAFGSGLVLSTGIVDSIPGRQSRRLIFNFGGDGDHDLDSCSGTTTYDACFISFDCVPQHQTIQFNFSFGSEEYPEYVNTQFNDIFAIFVSGQDSLGNAFRKNLAVIPGTNTPVNVNNINSLKNATYYTDNTNDLNVGFDGCTKGFGANLDVVSGHSYHFKIVIADVNDGGYDSGILFSTNCFRSINSNTTEIKSVTNNLAFELFPNPATNSLQVKTDQNLYEHWKITNILGVEVKAGMLSGDKTIDVSELQNGRYFIELKGRSGISTQSFFKVN